MDIVVRAWVCSMAHLFAILSGAGSQGGEVFSGAQQKFAHPLLILLTPEIEADVA